MKLMLSRCFHEITVPFGHFAGSYPKLGKNFLRCGSVRVLTVMFTTVFLSTEIYFALRKKLYDRRRLFVKKKSHCCAKYNNIVLNRHMTAHSAGPNMTFDELVENYKKGNVIFDYIEKAIR
jgi:hypothetical protein